MYHLYKKKTKPVYLPTNQALELAAIYFLFILVLYKLCIISRIDEMTNPQIIHSLAVTSWVGIPLTNVYERSKSRMSKQAHASVF